MTGGFRRRGATVREAKPEEEEMNERVAVVAGSLAQKPEQGGHSWVLLQYLLGLRKLGWNVLFIDRLEPEMCLDEEGKPCPFEWSQNLRYFLRVMHDFGLQESFSLLYDGGRKWIGLSRKQLLRQTRGSSFLLNIMGFLQDEEILAAANRRVFLDIDPGFGQMWKELGLADVFQGHDQYVTVGGNVGQPDCRIPSCGLDWITTLPPVVLDLWPVQRCADNGRVTSVATWRGRYGPVDFGGSRYGLRVHEFRKFVTIPVLIEGRFELALRIHPEEEQDLSLLRRYGWSLVDPGLVARDPCSYRSYVQDSMAEFGVAKHMYVASGSGWFSDRSACYLASGKPVLMQDTNLTRSLPTGQGLLTFTNLEEAVEAMKDVSSHYSHHAREARRLAETYFDSSGVLGRLLDRLRIN